MCREKTVLILCVLVLGTVGSGAEVFWSDGAANHNHLWTDPDNWEGGVVPGPGDEVQILSPQADNGHGPIIQAPMNITVAGLKNELEGRPGKPELTMTGGNLEVTDFVWWGDYDDIEAFWYHQGGNVTVANEFELGWGPGTGGAGTLDMTGGTITAGELVIPTGSGAYGEFYLRGGTFTVRDVGGLEINANGLIEVSGGTLVLAGDATGQIEGFIADGSITAYGGAGYFELDYNERNPGNTTLTAVPITGKAYRPTPADGARNVTFWLMEWGAGLNAALHDVYLGTSPDTLEYAGRQPLPVYWPAAGLAADTTYYWRVDEVEADLTTVHTGDVWTFSTAPETAYGPSPWDGARHVDTETELAWAAGLNATSHDVYFGTDKVAVETGAEGTAMGNQIPRTFDPGPLAADTTYYWRIDERAAGDVVHEGDVWSFTTLGPGGGVQAVYFRGTDLAGDPLLSQVEDTIDHSWGSGEVVAGISDQVSARWTGNLEAPFTETFTLITTSDDGIRLWLDGRLLIDNWTNHGTRDDYTRVDLVAGQYYGVKMEWYEDGGGAVAQLSWQSESIPRQIIPTGWLQLSVRATGPYPPNVGVDIPQRSLLRWNASESAARHDVYFADDAEAVANATPADVGIYRGQQALDATTFDPGPLEWSKTYYWRIDEVNTLDADSPWKGAVWSFTTADFIVIDDFETYTNEVGRRVFEVWVDGVGFSQPAPGHPGNGTGAAVGHDIWSVESPHYNGLLVETEDVHGGYQAMPLYYDNTETPYYSEADRTWAVAQDWTVNGVDTLVLYVRGLPGNGPDPLYVAVEDSGGGVGIVPHPDAAIVTSEEWAEWKMPLSELVDAGVTVTGVKKISVGVGQRDATTPGGTGAIYVDDVRVVKLVSTEEPGN